MTKVLKANLEEKIWLSYQLIIIFTLVLVDMAIDLNRQMSVEELVRDLCIEVSILVVVAFTTHFVWNKFAKERKIHEAVVDDLQLYKSKTIELQKKTQQLNIDFRNFIYEQFANWDLSKSEKEIALLLLQGKSTREIAQHRFTAERTIRNQCLSIYKKSQCAGRVHLSAAFLQQFLQNQYAMEEQNLHPIPTPHPMQHHLRPGPINSPKV